MTNEQIKKMLKEIAQEIDYDAYKDLFVNPENTDFAEERISNLIELVKSHISS